jgi:hypothetical protein
MSFLERLILRWGFNIFGQYSTESLKSQAVELLANMSSSTHPN